MNQCVTIPVATRHGQALPLPIALPPAPRIGLGVAVVPTIVAPRLHLHLRGVAAGAVAVRVGEVRQRRARRVARVAPDVPMKMKRE